MTFDPTFPYPSKRAPVLADNVVATSQTLATQAGIWALHRGGNAVDAALATAITLTVVEPTGNGLGSDAFALIWDGSTLHGLNASGRAPAAWTPGRFLAKGGVPRFGADTVTAPGAVSAWVALSDKFGKLPFADLFEPAIRHARDGFGVTPIIGMLWQSVSDQQAQQAGFKEMFMPGGRVPAPGERFASAEQAASLEAIAATRGEAFYRGELAAKIAACMADNGGALSTADLDEHRADWVPPLTVDAFGLRLGEIPPNGQGIAALIALGILERTDVKSHSVDSVASFHLQMEAMKLALADLAAHVGDPSAMTLPSEAFLTSDYLDRRAKLIDPEKAQDPGAGAPSPGGTVYLAAGDASGMMISYIQSNYMGFGSGVVVPGTGISLQNRGASFNLRSGHPNEVGPKKRPMHTIIPAFLNNSAGKPLMAFGVMGGHMQAQGHLQMVVRTQLFGQNVQAAIDAPRWRMTGGRTVAMEPGLPDAVYTGLRAMGHEVEIESDPDAAFGFGGAQLVQKRETGGYAAGSDPRKDGSAAGF